MSRAQEMRAGADGTARITLDDILTLKTVSQVTLTADGTRAAFVMREASSSTEFPVGRIDLLQVDGPDRQVPAPFTSGQGLDSAPRFSPDGRRLVFLSDREKPGTSQLYIISLDGGEAIRLTNERGGVAEPQWSPDGALLSYLVIAGESEETEKRKKDRDDAIVSSEVKGRRRLWVRAPDGTNPRAITPEDRHATSYDWSPNAEWIAAATSATSEANEGFGATRLVLFPLDPAGTPKDLGQVSMVGEVVWSLDGQTVATRNGSVEEFPKSWISFWPIDGGEPRQALRDLPATSFWLGRATAVADFLLATWHETHTPIYRVAALGESSATIADALLDQGSIPDTVVGSSPSLAPSADASRIVMVRTGGAHGDDLWLWEAGKGLRQLTDLNPSVARIALGRQQEIRWTSFDGLDIGGLLVTPPDYQEGTKYPLVVNVHGGPTWLWTDHLHANWHDWAQLLAAEGFVVLLPNPRGSAGRGNDFAYSNVRDIGGGDYRDVMAGVDQLIAQGIVDEARMGIGGWSYGGTLTPRTISQTNRFKAAVMGAGICNWISFAGVSDIRIFADCLFGTEMHRDASPLWERSALRHASQITTPTLIVHREKDVRVPVGQAHEFYSVLRHMGVPAELVVYPREGHSFVERHHQRDLQERIRDWFVHYLK